MESIRNASFVKA